jgi:type II secretory pathway pseudopilin PulG
MRPSLLKRAQRGFTLLEMLLVVGISFAIAGLSVLTYIRITRNLRTGGDARDLNGEVALAKMRAAAYFTKARVYVDLTAKTFEVDVWDKTGSGSWKLEGALQSLSQGVTFGTMSISTPPPGTQASIGQAPNCLDNTGSAISGTACVVFNSRGIPVDSSGTPTALDAFYINDLGSVYAVTITATGLVQTWRTDSSAAHWKAR